jgi:hypothetical protein
MGEQTMSWLFPPLIGVALAMRVPIRGMVFIGFGALIGVALLALLVYASMHAFERRDPEQTEAEAKPDQKGG